METIVATEAAAIIRFLKSLSGPLHITFEERGPTVVPAQLSPPKRHWLLSSHTKAESDAKSANPAGKILSKRNVFPFLETAKHGI
jgi:hypothetical protein